MNLVITDNNGNNIDLLGTLDGGAGDGTPSVTISLSAFTHADVRTLGGDDQLEIDYTGGTDFQGRTIDFNGGDPTSGTGDSLALTGGTFATAVYNYTDASSGSIQLAGQGLISYTGLEPITSTIAAADVTLNFNGGDETIDVTDPTPADNMITVDSTLGESLTLNIPSGSLTINGGSGDDIINLDGLDSVYEGFEDYNLGSAIGQQGWTTGGTVANGTINVYDPGKVITTPGGLHWPRNSQINIVNRSGNQFELVAEFRTGTAVNHNTLLKAWDAATSTAGPIFGINNGQFLVRGANYGTLNYGNAVVVGDWYRMTLTIDPAGNGGAGSGTLTAFNLTTGSAEATGLSGVTLEMIGLDLTDLTGVEARLMQVGSEIAGLVRAPQTDLIVNGDGGTDTVNVTGDLQMGTGDLTVTADEINSSAAVTATSGDVSMVATGDVTVSDTVTANDIAITGHDIDVSAPMTAADAAKITSSAGTVEVNAAVNVGAGGFSIDPPDTITITAPINSAGGPVNLEANNGVTISAAVDTGGGTFNSDADVDANGTGDFIISAAIGGFMTEADQKLTATDTVASDQFGHSVSVSGDTMVVGAPAVNGLVGAAYVFERSGGATWVQQAKLLASDGASSDVFGISVAVDGDTIVVGADSEDVPSINTGAAYVFVEPVGGWSGTLNESAKLLASDAALGDALGTSVAIDGDVIVAGAASRDTGGLDRAGAAYVFEKPVGGWSGTLNEDALLVNATPFFRNNLGSSVSVDGGTIAVGADQTNGSNAGRIYIFEEPGGGWSGNLNEQATLLASGPGQKHLGTSVSISGDSVLGGADIDSENGTYAGAAFVFSRPAGGWAGTVNEDIKLLPAQVANNDSFGYSVALDGNTAVVGAWGDDDLGSNAGAAYFFSNNVSGPGFVVSGGGTATITAADAEIGGAIDAGAGTVTFLGSTAGRSFDLGAAGGSGQFVLTDAELDNVTTSSKVVVGGGSEGNVTFTAAVDLANADTLEIITGGTVNDTDGSTVFTDTNLAIDAAQGIGTTGALDTAVSNFEGDGGTGGINLANTGNITIGNVAQSTIDGAFATGGPVSISAASSINVVSPINSGGGPVNLVATENILVQADVSSGGGDITFNADSDGTAPDGGILVDTGVTVASSGGDIIMGGGSDPSAMPAIGTSPTSHRGVFIRSATVSAGAGDISLRGVGTNDAVNVGSSLVETTSGNITIVANGSGASSADNGALNTGGNGTIRTNSGAIDITANGTGNASGVRLSPATGGSIVSTGSGTISIQASSVNNSGLVSSYALNVIGGPSATGDISITVDTYSVTAGIVQSTGNLTIAPITPGSSIGIGGGTGTLNIRWQRCDQRRRRPQQGLGRATTGSTATKATISSWQVPAMIISRPVMAMTSWSVAPVTTRSTATRATIF